MQHAFLGSLLQPPAVLCAHSVSVLREGLLVLTGEQVFLLTAYEVGAVDGEKALSLVNILVRCIRGNILNPARKAGLNISEPLLIDVDISRNTQIVVHIFHFNGRRGYADLLHSLRR